MVCSVHKEYPPQFSISRLNLTRNNTRLFFAANHSREHDRLAVDGCFCPRMQSICLKKKSAEGGGMPLPRIAAGWNYGVTALKTFDQAEEPPALFARTRK